MFVLTDKKTGGVYANSKSGDEQGKKNVLVFAEKDDAERYAMMLENEEDKEMDLVEVDDALALRTCKMYNYKYAVITPDDIVIPPKNDNV